MSLKATVRTDSLGNITIHIEGGLDFESCPNIHLELISIEKANPYSTITLDLYSLDFVGSSGINIFVETLKTLIKRKSPVWLTNVKSEFLKVFKLYGLDANDYVLTNEDREEKMLRRAGQKSPEA